MRLLDVLKKKELSRVNFEEGKSFVNEEIRQKESLQTPEIIYHDLLGLARIVLSDALKNKPINIAFLKEKLKSLIEYSLHDEFDLLRLIDCYDVKEDYLVTHSVNVCILSLEIAKGINYKTEQLLGVAVASFLHDVGMTKVKSILDKKRRLFNAEYEEVKNHVNYGVSILEKLEGVNEDTLAAVRQHHERADGSGYLEGLTLERIHEYSRIIGLADVYEALIHSRPYRDKFLPFDYQTIKEIISNRQMFDPYIVRVFVERVTKHPAYMLWLNAAGIQQILEGQKAGTTQKSEIVEQAIPRRSNRFFIMAILILVTTTLTTMLIFNITKKDNKKIVYPLEESLHIAQNKMPLKIAYDFTKNTSDTYSVSLDLSGLNLDGYYFLAFQARIDDAQIISQKQTLTLKVEFENKINEKSEYYSEGLNRAWHSFLVPLSNFKEITDWSSVARIYFELQPWNTEIKKGTIYIDGIHFLKKTST